MVNKLSRQCIISVNKLTYRNLGGKNTAAMKPGERIIVCTPGGGGYGPPDELDERDQKRQKKMYARDQWRGAGSVVNYQAMQESA
jgi:5-oxoprolinase (ATP-hydrolysing)